MKAEEKVKQVYPDAYYCRGWIYDRDGQDGVSISYGRTPAKAWADAWRRIQRERSGK